MDLSRFGAKVVLFSDTTGGGVHGWLRRARLAAGRPPGELFDTARRKAFRQFRPRRVMPFAQALHLEVTNACNLKCVMCPRTGMDRPAGFMPRELFENLLRQLAEQRSWIESVALMGLGEPLLHPELFAWARAARRAGLRRIYTSTNATLLTEENVDRLLEPEGFELVICSVDGVNKATYESVRPGCSFETVEAGIDRLLAAKRKANQAAVSIELQILLMQETEPEVEVFCERWVPHLGESDRVLVKEADTFGGQVPDHRTAAHRRREPAERFACRQLWKDMSIGWDGQVTICCKDVLYKLAVGNAHTDSLADLWRGERWSAYRRLHQDKLWDRLDPCTSCREWWI